MRPPLRRRRPRPLVAIVGALLAAMPAAAAAQSTTATPASPDAKFMAANEQAMAKMHTGMMVRPTGNVDADFAAIMIPHHQGAIDMAVLELRYGHNEQLRRIAQEIVVEQMQEITAMRLALGQPLPPQAEAPTQPSRLREPAFAAPPGPRHMPSMEAAQ